MIEGCDRGVRRPRLVTHPGGRASQRRLSHSRKETQHAYTRSRPCKRRHIACNDLVPGCSFTASAATDEELVAKVVEHAAHGHGITEVTPALAAKVKAAITTR
jgi:predicted small metal-binding protein